MAVTSSIPSATDWLVTNITALTACAKPVEVSDGWPTVRADKGVAIGITPDDDETGAESVISQLGANMETETYLIPCIVWARAAGENANKTARDAAFTIINAILTLIRGDRTLGGALHSGYAIVPAFSVIPTGDADAAGDGRWCEVRFMIRCTNRY